MHTMTKEQKIAQFDVNALATNSNLFGLPFNEDESEIIVIPVPWQVTVSYGVGTMDGPAAILEASAQVDIFDRIQPDFWKKGVYMIDEPADIRALSEQTRVTAEKNINALEEGKAPNQAWIAEVDAACEQMNNWVQETVGKYLDQGKKVVLLGGDHSTPLGMLRALKERNESFGVLQIDAHADLREAYEGFKFSHASITYNALNEGLADSWTLLGIRDFCEEEYRRAKDDNRVQVFYDRDVKFSEFRGETWESVCKRVVQTLPKKLYITFDIDGLDPRFCPSTGTPVAGGYTPEQMIFLFQMIQENNIEIIGFDINEVGVSENEWDANVGARLLFQMLATLF